MINKCQSDTLQGRIADLSPKTAVSGFVRS